MSADNSQPVAPKSQAATSSVDFTQEIRFAVVMYGGSSLAIYMNGVAQELLRLVRATAPDPIDGTRALLSDEEIGDGTKGFSTERVYRKLGRMLSRGSQPDPTMREETQAPIRTRFVIDILSGTSAGGINSVFLAKALANNQDLTPLKKLWIEQGDAAVLINDAESDEGVNLGAQNPPRSLFNSRRMYYVLLDALQGMDHNSSQNGSTANNKAANNNAANSAVNNCAVNNCADGNFVSPLAEEIDLFTTATDIRGMEINIPLADSVAQERRHLNTFHFRFVSQQLDDCGRNEFIERFNPFLAFAARVTSAHPAPFEPMKLADIDEILDKHADYRNTASCRSDDPCWQTFYEEYLEPPAEDNDGSPLADNRTSEERAADRKRLADQFRSRPFSDGGVLDNSPFSFAIDKLRFRHTQLPVDRKLIYIEPVPEHLAEERVPTRPPDAIENGWLSLSTLPRYQFIRDDLLRLIERNRLIQRVNNILKGVVDDESARLGSTGEKQPLTTYQFGTATLDEMIELMGSAYGGYQRLRVSETTDELVKLVAGGVGLDERSSEFLAVRDLATAWRNSEYDPYGTKIPESEKDKISQDERDKRMAAKSAIAQQLARPDRYSENWFLFLYDLKWRLRRLKFVLSKIDDIACLDENAFKLLSIRNNNPTAKGFLDNLKQQLEQEKRKQQLEREKRKQQREQATKATLGAATDATEATLDADATEATQGKQLRNVLRRIKKQLNDVLKELQLEQEKLASTKYCAGTTTNKSNACGQPPTPVNPMGAAIENLKRSISAADLQAILKQQTNQEREKKDDELFLKKKAFKEFLDSLDNYLRAVTDKASGQIRGRDVQAQQNAQPENQEEPDAQKAEQPHKDGKQHQTGILEVPQTPPASWTFDYKLPRSPKEQLLLYQAASLTFDYLLRCTLFYFYENFDRYDMISYPILYATNVGDETDVVEVFRISPEDAKVLVPDEELRRRKLAGTSLGNFGAFFDQSFRTNDILWGRLDCADRMITALLSSAAPQATAEAKELERVRVELIREASRLIIADELSGADKAYLRKLLLKTMAETRPGENPAQAFDRVFDQWLQSLPQQSDDPQDFARVQEFLRLCLAGRDPLEDFVDTNNFQHQLPAEAMVKAAARASRVFGKMLEGIADLHRKNKKSVAWITRLAQIFWSLVEVALPNSIPNLIFHYWLKLLYFFEALLVLGGTLLINPTIQQFGFFAFVITATIHGLVLFLSDYFAPDDNSAPDDPPPPKRLTRETAVQEIKSAGIQVNDDVAQRLAESFEIRVPEKKSDDRTDAIAVVAAKRKRRWRTRRVIRAALIILAIVLVIVGGLFVAEVFGADSFWPVIQKLAQPEQTVPIVAPAATPAAAAAATVAVEPNSFRVAARWVIVAVVWLVFLGTIRDSLKAMYKERRVQGVRLIGILALILGLAISASVSLGFWNLRSKNQTLPGGFHQPMVALEMAESEEDVKQAEETFADLNNLHGDNDTARLKLKQQVDIDFGFIALYTLINLSLCYWLSKRNSFSVGAGKALGIIAAAGAVGAAVSDVMENLRLYDLLNKQTTATVLHQLRAATLSKWGLTYAALALFSLIFLRRKSWLILIGLLLLLVAGIGFYGLAEHLYLEPAFALMGVGMILTGCVMWLRPRRFADGLRP